ncbi:nickel transporter permease [Pontibacillus marinus]|uniref:Diguanylate cyclase n=1 Tax=Pontibacillus marinus BH030004 = DSM 16465 TaxID=1385511 RepID=A0A0A5FS70_9BACI|nr:nickel transporter permease [Pontibacillus marinus]KGX83621.1 diguanylate cyclase [Pontibacillus marinus BH030004 = DSM 16465]
MSAQMDLEQNSKVKAKKPKKESSLWGDALSRILKSKTSFIGLMIILLLIVVAVLAPVLAPYHPIDDGSIIDRYQPPSAEHWLGTDQLGRDILSRIIYGARISIKIGVIAVGIAFVVGTLLGGIAGYIGRWVDNVIMRIIDIMMAFPSILLAIAMVAILGKSLTNAMIAVGIVGVPQFARIVRSTVLSIKEKEFVESARASGVKNGRILMRHVLPNCMAPIIVQATLSVGTAILDAAGLSFLGLGAQGATPEWGVMLSDGRAALQTSPWVITFPGLAIFLVVLGFNLFGDGLRDALDPRLKQ